MNYTPFYWIGENHKPYKLLLNNIKDWKVGQVFKFDNKPSLIVIGVYNTEKRGIPCNLKFDFRFYIYKNFINKYVFKEYILF